MRLAHLALAIGLTLGMGGAAAATPLAPTPADVIAQPNVAVDYVRHWRGRGHHYGWYKPHRRVYYVPRRHHRYYAPRRHYGYYAPRRYHSYYAPRRHYGYYGYHRPRPSVYIGF